MRKKHLDQVIAIERRSFPAPWSKSAFASHLKHPEFAYYLVALADDTVIGYTGLFFGGGHGQITNLAVHPDYRKKGIGAMLLWSLIEFSVAKNVLHLSLEVRVTNVAAQNLYRGFGFEVVGTRKGYYQETGEDAYVMCLYDLQDKEAKKIIEQFGEERGYDANSGD